jgi:hypothetical protein
MSHWDNAVASTKGMATHEDFETAAYRLVAEQVLYASDRGNKLSCWLIEDYEREFRHALEPMGVGLLVNRRLRYACALPRHTKIVDAGMEPTLLVLVLRRIYDEHFRLGQVSDNSEVFVDLIELAEKYRQSTNGRELPRGGQMRQLMRTVQRWGIARRQDDVTDEDADVEQPFVIVIRPAIADVLGETPLQRLALFGGQSAATAKTATTAPQLDVGDDQQVADDGAAPKEDA